MNAEVNVKVKVLDGPDAGYSFEEKNVIPLYSPLHDGRVHPYTLEYKFMTPSLFHDMAQYACAPNKKDTLGVVGADIPPVSEVIDMLKIMRESGEQVQLPGENANRVGVLVKDMLYEDSFEWVLNCAIKILEQVSR